MQFGVTEMEVFPFLGFQAAEDVMLADWGARFQPSAGAFEAVETIFGGQRLGRERSARDSRKASAGVPLVRRDIFSAGLAPVMHTNQENLAGVPSNP